MVTLIACFNKDTLKTRFGHRLWRRWFPDCHPCRTHLFFDSLSLPTHNFSFFFLIAVWQFFLWVSFPQYVSIFFFSVVSLISARAIFYSRSYISADRIFFSAPTNCRSRNRQTNFISGSSVPSVFSKKAWLREALAPHTLSW